jgi:hypothetical protein
MRQSAPASGTAIGGSKPWSLASPPAGLGRLRTGGCEALPLDAEAVQVSQCLFETMARAEGVDTDGDKSLIKCRPVRKAWSAMGKPARVRGCSSTEFGFSPAVLGHREEPGRSSRRRFRRRRCSARLAVGPAGRASIDTRALAGMAASTPRRAIPWRSPPSGRAQRKSGSSHEGEKPGSISQ